MAARGAARVLVVAHESLVDRDDGAAATLEQLGARVETHDLWAEPSVVWSEGGPIRALVFEAGERLDFAASALRAWRKQAGLEQIPALLAVPHGHVARLDPAAGFDDFILTPYVPPELYARIRALEWKTSEFSGDERIKFGTVVIDRAAHEVRVDGRAVVLTAKEFALLVFLVGQRGKVVSRATLLARVWGARYDGGERTVDIHVRRLRAKLGHALPLETLRGAGYKISSATDSS